jgi:hypothetical protein
MSSERIYVLARRRGEQTLEQALSDLWRESERRGWLAIIAPRVLVQVGQRWRSDLVVETARMIARLLAARVPTSQVEILDQAASTNGSHGSQVADEAVERAVTVSGIAAHALRVPERWFESFSLITVTGAGPDPATRMSAVLDAQAEPLRRLNGTMPLTSVAYEAHRLFASDLVVACATTRREDPASEACWFVSPSDVAVEMALMRASGCDPSDTPYVKMLARHETLPAFELDDAAPTLAGYLGSAWRAEVHAARTSFAASRHAVIQDVVAVRRNLRRIPPAIRRRLANRKRGNG